MQNRAREQIRETLRGFVSRTDPGIPKKHTEAIQLMSVAREATDIALMVENIEKAFCAAAQALDEAIAYQLGWPTEARIVLGRISELMRDLPREDWDEFHRDIRTHFDAILRPLIKLRYSAVKVERNYRLNNAQQLDDDIKELQQLRNEILDHWPWSNEELPAVNQEMVAASMAALQRGEQGVPIDDLLSQLSDK
jgi:hypothetical protein